MRLLNFSNEQFKRMCFTTDEMKAAQEQGVGDAIVKGLICYEFVSSNISSLIRIREQHAENMSGVGIVCDVEQVPFVRMHTTYRFISSLFFSCLFDKLFDLAMSRKSQSLDVPVNVIMDEFIAIGKIPDFEQKLATVRSAGIAISMIFQNLAQLQQEYPDGMWESLLSNCSNFICLACNDMSTAEYLTKRAGTQTIALENKRIDRTIMNIGAPEKVSMSYSVGERSVMQETELIKLAQQM